MAKLIVELPEEVHKELKKKATHEHRTIKDVVTDLVEDYLSPRGEDTGKARGTGFCGRWENTRTAEEIITDIKSHRKWFGRRRPGRG